MKKNDALRIAEDGYAPLIKAVDFMAINLSMLFLVNSMFQQETAIDVAVAFLVAAFFLLFGEYSHLYRANVRRCLAASVPRVIFSGLCAFITMEVVKWSLQDHPGSAINNLHDGLYYFWFASTIVVLITLRIFAFLASRHVYGRIKKRKHIAIIGLSPAALAIEKQLLAIHRTNDINIEIYDDRTEQRFGYMARSPYRGRVAALLEKANNNDVDEVYITLPMIAKTRIIDYITKLSDTTVDTFVVPDLYSYNLSSSQFKSVGNVQILSVFATPFDGAGALIKRLEDIVLSVLILLLITPLLLAIAIGVKRSSPGPILFKQDRYGLGGKKIKVWKFRSMTVMENNTDFKQATRFDPRVTKFGAFMRRTSLDELPQFFNVLQGTMSIVGPRPHAVAHNEQYRKIVDNYMIRHKIKPGVTGWAQINGYRGETQTVEKMKKRVQYDIEYLQNWSLWLDFQIVFLTIFKGFVNDSAY
ncbi:undecaprenyl-phosphate glucose phosphotransferase [Vibrio mediterranei]|uniref:undecaprenyl-phosphate glucose phosphotransferase n=1 Tax=Vibrio mediterranei TaxID=689 RepID=UPI002284C173|nr:undecaprenyl-phosphate glucose phosphotransferase [Vibrio mediterranei]MCY9855260.1 undecaprenyl-phosphate glucose phosphotransferase [Vibrio mediterranei]